MGGKKTNQTDLIFIFSHHSPQAFHYSLFTAKKIQSAIRTAKSDDKKILIVHEGTYYPDFRQETFDEETFEKYLNSVDLQQIESDLQQRYMRNLRLVESKKLFRKGHYAKYHLAPNVSHTIERINFNFWLYGVEAEFYQQKKVNAIQNEDVSKAIQYTTLWGKALAKEAKGRDEMLIQQLMEIGINRQVDLIMVPRGNVHSYISNICEAGGIFGKISVDTEPWIPSPMDKWIISQITGEPQQETERIAATKDLAWILKANQLKASGIKALAAREQAIAIIDSIPQNKIDAVISVSQRIKFNEFQEIFGLSGEE